MSATEKYHLDRIFYEMYNGFLNDLTLKNLNVVIKPFVCLIGLLSNDCGCN